MRKKKSNTLSSSAPLASWLSFLFSVSPHHLLRALMGLSFLLQYLQCISLRTGVPVKEGEADFHETLDSFKKVQTMTNH